jgi:hypothetical protein
VSLPDLVIWNDDLEKRNKVHCTCVLGWGYLGLVNKERAKELLEKTSEFDINHQGAQIHLEMCGITVR